MRAKAACSQTRSQRCARACAASGRQSLIPAAVLLCLVLACIPASAAQPCHGRWLNPLTDVCWACIFPIRIGPVEIGFGQEDAGDSAPLICSCPAPPPLFLRIGIGISYWEPARVSEVVRTPFCSTLLGGIQLASHRAPAGTHQSHAGSEDGFYHVHWYVYPLLAWVGLLSGTSCQQAEPFDLAYLTELDPLWQDDELTFLLNPEAALFGSPPAQAACAADCAAAAFGFPLDRLFWCAGCQGSLYPLTGNTIHHSGGVDTSLLLTQRMAGKLHRQLIARDTSSRDALCQAQLQPILRKGQYKTQMLYPRPYTAAAQPFGRLSLPWASGREYPVRGEDWSYLVFRRRLCCAF